MVVGVLVVSDDPLIRQNLENIFSTDSGYILVDSIPLDELESIAGDARPGDVMVLDPGWNPISARAALGNLESYRGTLVLLPGGIEFLDPIASLFQGVISRSAPPARLLAAASAVASGLMVREMPQAGSLLPREESLFPSYPLDPLTRREIDVLACLVDGLSNKQIAARLDISEHTAKFHVTSILSKLGAQSRTEAVVRAARLGLVRM